MKKYLIISNSTYSSGLATLEPAARSANELNRLLLSPLFHGQAAEVRQNITTPQIIKNVKKISDIKETRHLILFLIGHGATTSKDCVVDQTNSGFCGIDANRDDVSNDFISWVDLINALSKTSFECISLIIDCCFAAFSIEALNSSAYSPDQPKIEVLAPTSRDARIYTDGRFTQVSGTILSVLSSSKARVPNSNVATLSSIAQASNRLLKRKYARVATEILFTSNHTGPGLGIISVPEPLPKKIQDNIDAIRHRGAEPIDHITDKLRSELYEWEDQQELNAIYEHLDDLHDELKFSVPGNAQQLWHLLNELRDRHNAVGPVQHLASVSVFTFQSHPYIEEALGRDVLFDEKEHILFDTQATRFPYIPPARDVNIYIHRLDKIEIIKFRNALSSLGRKLRDVENCRLNIRCCGFHIADDPGKKSVIEDAIWTQTSASIAWTDQFFGKREKLIFKPGIFFELLNRHSSRIFSASEKSEHKDRYPVTMDMELEPNFLLVNRAGVCEMVILDSKDSIDQHSIQKSNEPRKKVETLDKEEVFNLGYTNIKKVHPFFQDPTNLVDRIHVDSKIFSLYLSLPNLAVRIPSYALGLPDGSHRSVSLSTFYRTLQQAHSPDKVLVSNIARRRKPKNYVRSFVSEHPCYSRFAPTPSGSLHVGNLRTAVLSYLFSMPKSGAQNFEVRFDDTNVDSTRSEKFKKMILNDVRWIGIDGFESFSQSDAERQSLYVSTFHLLRDAGFLSELDDEIHLNIDALNNPFGNLHDLNLGARVTHNIERVPKKDALLNYSLRWKKGLFKYKFTGIIDDLLNSSIVIRDSRQLNSHFTYKQSVIAEAIRQALHVCRASGKIATLERFEREIADARPDRTQPIPLFCPPLYMHVGTVVDNDGRPLSKRLGNCGQDIHEVRTTGAYFAESYLAWIITSFGPKFLTSLGYPNLDSLIQDICLAGNRSFLLSLRGRFDVWSLVMKPRSIKFDDASLVSIEKGVLKHASVATLTRFLESTDIAKQASVMDVRKLASAVWSEREAFSSARELFVFLRHCSKMRMSVPTTEEFERKFGTLKASEKADYCKNLRLDLMGVEQGPRILSLLNILERFKMLGGKFG